MNIKKMMWWMSSSQPAPTSFKQIIITNWKQFKSIDIEFHDKLTILTGANASGKTTILNLLAQHFDWHSDELSTPVFYNGLIQYIKRWLNNNQDDANENIGEIKYENNKVASLEIPNNNDLKFTINISGKQKVDGLYIPSFRHGFNYQAVESSPSIKNISEIFNTYVNSIKTRTSGSEDRPSNYYIKETLLAWSSLYKENSEANENFKLYFDGFEEILRNSLPKSLGFEKFEILGSEIVLVTKADSYLLDSCSGGISKLIDLIWQIYLLSLQSKKGFTVLIDEIENHLHPAMQREVLPQLLSAFSKVTFIVATHSPLIIGSVKESNIYILQYIETEEGKMKVKSDLLDLKNKAKSATEILNEVLGVPFTMPLWVESKLNELVSKYSQQDISEDTFDKMRSDLKEIGLEELMPEAMKKTLNKND